MRRADRLFQIVQLLRTRRVLTAGHIARELEVSPRTVYRDVADLIACGVPIEGEAGVGYCLARGFDLPPLIFSRMQRTLWMWAKLVAMLRRGEQGGCARQIFGSSRSSRT